MGINGRAKGKRNERDVAKWFKQWTGWDFHSTPASGGLRWGKDQRVIGDIVPPLEHADLFPFSVETKVRQQKKSKKKGIVHDQIKLGDLIIDWNDCKLLEFWEQCLDDASRGGKEPLMLLRNTGMSKGLYYTFFDHDMGKKIEKEFDIQFMYISQVGLAITNNRELEDYCHIEFFKFVNKHRTIR